MRSELKDKKQDVPLAQSEEWLLGISKFLEKHGFAIGLYNESGYKTIYSVVALAEVTKSKISRNQRDHTYHLADFNDAGGHVRRSSFAKVIDGDAIEPLAGDLPVSVLESNEDLVVLTACRALVSMLGVVTIKPDDSWVGNHVRESMNITPEVYLKETFSALVEQRVASLNGS